MLDFSFRHWRDHSPLLKGYLALTLERAGRHDDAVLVFDAVMDSAKTDRDLGTYWAPEDRAWLWYNDTIETHAFALGVLDELDPTDERRHGMVQWLLLNKKLNHWKSTRATAEVISSLVHYLEQENGLGVREDATVIIGPRRTEMVFEPDEYTGARNRVVVPGPEVDPKTMSTIVVEKQAKGFAFASATWHFSTEKLPEEARGDLFGVTRQYFRRFNDGNRWVLRPLADGEELAPGDQLEVHLSISAKHAAEYVHLQRPEGRGLRARDPPLAVQVGSRDRLVRGGARLGDQLLLRVAPGGRVHLQVPAQGQHGRDLQGRTRHPAEHVRARVHRVLGGPPAGGGGGVGIPASASVSS